MMDLSATSLASTSTPQGEGPPEDTTRPIGCAHYKRKSKFVTPCCNKVYTCRFCHDEKEDHEVERKKVTELVCTLCETRQPVQSKCQKCGITFGKYTCLECNLFDDEDRNQFHCKGCGICRVGGADRFFHCEKCNMCLPVLLQNRHKCVENMSRANCPVCLEDIHTSRTPCHIPMCGHLLHKNCFEDLLKSGLYACPTCQTSLMNMTNLWRYLDNEISRTPMPPAYKDFVVFILCKDCHKEGYVSFHIMGNKCLYCGSYNTCRLKGPLPEPWGYKKCKRCFWEICSTVKQYVSRFLSVVYLFLTGFFMPLCNQLVLGSSSEASNINNSPLFNLGTPSSGHEDIQSVVTAQYLHLAQLNIQESNNQSNGSITSVEEAEFNLHGNGVAVQRQQ